MMFHQAEAVLKAVFSTCCPSLTVFFVLVFVVSEFVRKFLRLVRLRVVVGSHIVLNAQTAPIRLYIFQRGNLGLLCG